MRTFKSTPAIGRPFSFAGKCFLNFSTLKSNVKWNWFFPQNYYSCFLRKWTWQPHRSIFHFHFLVENKENQLYFSLFLLVSYPKSSLKRKVEKVFYRVFRFRHPSTSGSPWRLRSLERPTPKSLSAFSAGQKALPARPAYKGVHWSAAFCIQSHYAPFK